MCSGKFPVMDLECYYLVVANDKVYQSVPGRLIYNIAEDWTKNSIIINFPFQMTISNNNIYVCDHVTLCYFQSSNDYETVQEQ